MLASLLSLLLWSCHAAETAMPVSSVDASLGAFGAAMAETDAGLVVSQPMPGSTAQELGLEAGDILLFFDRMTVRLREEAAAAWRAWIPGARLSAVVRRGQKLMILETKNPALEAPFKRGLEDLSAQEKEFKSNHLEAAARQASSVVEKTPSLDVTLPKKHALWVRFPEGISWETKAGDLLMAETIAPLASSTDLEKIILPAHSQVWVKVVGSKTSLETSQLSMMIYRLRPAGGRDYPATGSFVDIASPVKTERMTPGSTLIVAMPLPAERRRKQLLRSDTRLKVVLKESLVLSEAPSYYKAGPGLWLASTKEPNGGFVVSKVSRGSPAEKAGLKVGQKIHEIDGRSASRMTFTEAVERVFGDADKPLRLEVDVDGKRAALQLSRTWMPSSAR